MLSYALCLFVATDGHTRRVTISVFIGVLVNVVVDVLAVGCFDWGIKGAAWGSLAQFAVNILLLALYLRHPACSYTLRRPQAKSYHLFLENIKEGAAVSISNILMAVSVLLISNIVFNALGERGLFFWSVCLQMLLVSVVFINGVMESLFAIGGVMLGEHDIRGLDLLARRALITICLLIGAMIVLMYIPEAVGILFGIENPQEMDALDHVLRIFSLMMLPFAITLVLVAIYQMLEFILLSVICVVGQLAVIILVTWLIAFYNPMLLWWGFPLGSGLFLIGQLIFSYLHSRRKGCGVSALTLIPYHKGGCTFDSSVKYQLNEVNAVLEEIDSFLKASDLCQQDSSCMKLCCEELMTSIVRHSQGRLDKYSFDVHIYSDDEITCVTLKYGGRLFNPVRDLHHINHIAEKISYKYMYGLNIVLIKN